MCKVWLLMLTLESSLKWHFIALSHNLQARLTDLESSDFYIFELESRQCPGFT